MRIGLLALVGVLLGGILFAPAQEPKDTGEIVFREGLAIPPVGRSGRSAVHTDAIEHQIVTGKWRAPKAGDEVKLPDGSARKWEPIKAGEDGWLSSRALGGGYAFCSVTFFEKRVMILEASGHSMVYVNGEPRVGDPYQTGYVRLPVELKEGENEFLFQVGRGRVRAKLLPPRAVAQLDTGDLTLPDMVVDERLNSLGAIVVLNVGDRPLTDAVLRTRCGQDPPVATKVWNIPPFSQRKVAFKLEHRALEEKGELPVVVQLFPNAMAEQPLDTVQFNIRAVTPQSPRKITFRSMVDGSVQYYALTPLANSSLKEGEKPALFMTLHGAGVEALGQVSCYANKTWGHVVAPTNRRPFGFDWEDWGRLDALEVLEDAERNLKTDPRRTYLTGHSMGGHGAWQLGAIYPHRWAAIAPSAGWISMYSYAGARRPENPDARQEMLLRAAGSSDTLAMLKNYGQHGVYVLHGERDDNVPVGQAREMRKQLAAFHSDFAYYERPGAGHWWGNECVDWPPIFEFFSRRTLPQPQDVRELEFTTMNPQISSRSHWVEIRAQLQPSTPSTVRLRHDAAKATFSGSTENVAELSLATTHLKRGLPLELELDGQKLDGILNDADRICVERVGARWERRPHAQEQPFPPRKSPRRTGPFKNAFQNRMLFVYGTRGTTAENAWALAKARYDAEAFWYRGNGSVEVLADVDFGRVQSMTRSVVLYGNADTNAAWATLLPDSPVRVDRGLLKVGDREIKGEDMACLFLRPRPKEVLACVAVVSGTGLAGMRLTDRIPYFVSGVGIPDLLVLDSTSLEKAEDGIVVAGFFANDWSVDKGEFAWRK